MKKHIQDFSVMCVIITMLVVLAFFIKDWTGYDLKFASGWVACSIYYLYKENES